MAHVRRLARGATEGARAQAEAPRVRTRNKRQTAFLAVQLRLVQNELADVALARVQVVDFAHEAVYGRLIVDLRKVLLTAEARVACPLGALALGGLARRGWSRPGRGFSDFVEKV